MRGRGWGGWGGRGASLPPSITGETRLRDTLLRCGGFVVLAVPYWEWAALRGEGGTHDAYLRARLTGALQLAGPAAARE